MRRSFSLLLFALFVILSIPAVLAQEATAPPSQADIPLVVVDSVPFAGEELALDAPVTIYFDRPVDCASAEDAFAIDPIVAGAISCSADDASLTFTPDAPFERGVTYSITLSEALAAADGGTLDAPFELTLNSIGFLQVVEVLPADQSVQVGTDAVITVIFNRPVVPLTSVDQMDGLPQPLTIDPPLDGTGEWLNTSIYVFRPEVTLTGGISYTVTVDAGLTAVDGAALSEPFTWTFSTRAPHVVTTVPADLEADRPLDQTVSITFDQPMDRQSVADNFFLRPLDQEQNPSATIAVTAEWTPESTTVTFTPDEPLALSTTYIYSFEDFNAVFAQNRTARLEPTPSARFATVPPPAIVATNPIDGSDAVFPYDGFTIGFASPMNEDTLLDKITIEPAPPTRITASYRTWSNDYFLSFRAEPNTDYTVTIAPGMEDVYGNRIEETLVIRYRTVGYGPDVMLQVPSGGVGFYNAYREETALFATHRNISQLDLTLYGVSVTDFVFAANGQYYNPAENFFPAEGSQLSAWQLPVNAPSEEYVYEYLNLGSPGAGSCPGAPPSRLQVGDTAIVITDPNPLNARAEPVTGEIVESMYRDYSIPIVGGPVCANGLLWWEVQLRDGSTGWAAEGTITDGEPEYFIDVRIPADVTPIQVTQSPDGGALAPGIYLLSVNSPETAANERPEIKHFMIVATANLVVKYGIDELVVWATDVQSGLPIANAPISLYDATNTVIGTGITDENGITRIPINRVESLYYRLTAVLDDGGQFGIGFTEWSEGLEPWRFEQAYDYYPNLYSFYLYTDRPVYRPGQPVYYRGVVRLKDDVTYTPLDRETVPVTIYNDRGEVLFQADVPLTDYGTFSGQFMLADDAVLGSYRVEVTLPTFGENTQGQSIFFTVAEYRAPEYTVTVTPELDELLLGDTLRATVDSRYFFGGAVTNAAVEYYVYAEPSSFNYTGEGYYSFSNFDYTSDNFIAYGQQIANGTLNTDENGVALLEIPAAVEEGSQTYLFTVEAVVRDESDQFVAGRTQVVVHPGEVYIGLRPESYVGTANEPNTIEIISVDWESSRIGGQAVELDVSELRWYSVQELDANGRAAWTWEVEEIPVAAGDVQTDLGGSATYSFTPPNGGIFRVRATTQDNNGNMVISSTLVWVSDTSYVAWRQDNNNRIDLIADQPEYEVGDTAEILITSPFQGTAEALITVERGGVLFADRVSLTSNSLVYELPITDDFAPNAFVSVVIVKGVDENNPVAGFRMGLIELLVDNSRKQITIEIASSTGQAAPQETVTYTLRTTNYAGEPVQAEVGVALTDLATLTLLPPNSGPILDWFYNPQGLGIRTASALTINTDLLTQTTLDTIKGGGGGGGGDFGVFEVREEFVDTAYWDAALVTNENGEAQFQVTLPDNLTTWRLDARAVTGGQDGLTLVGEETFDLISTKPLLVRPATPRFFVVGDQAVLGAVVNNNTDETLSVVVRLEASGVTLAGDAQQTISIPARGRGRVEWVVTVGEVENVELIFFADGNNGAYTDATRPVVGQGENRLLPVYRYSVPEVVGKAGLLREGGTRTEAVALPRRFDSTQGELTVSIQPSLAATTLDSLEVLENFPHQCTEQTVSRFLPNIMTFRALDALNVADEQLRAELEFAVNIGLQRLFSQQHPDGGWGWFVQDESNPLTTAYALIGLSEARAQGFFVPDEVIANAQTYLSGSFVTVRPGTAQWLLNRQAFILYALARSGAADVGRTTTLWESRDALGYYAQAYLALTLHMIDPTSTDRTDPILDVLFGNAITSATGIHWEEPTRDPWNWNTDTRTTALILSAFVTLRPDSELNPQIVRWLMVARTGDGWETTQETAWAVMALTDWMVRTGELQPDYTYSAALNGEALAGGVASADSIRETQRLVISVSDLLTEEANLFAVERSEGPGVLYYTAYLRVYLPVPEIQPLNRGIIVNRRYTLFGDESEADITQARIGDIVQVRLTIIAPNDLHYVVIEDPLPAGGEAIDPNLNTAQQIGTQPELRSNDPFYDGWGYWWFSNTEFRDEKVVLYATYLPAGTYEYVYSFRAGFAGTYNVIPPTGSEFYFPEVYGRGAGTTFTILPSEDE